MSRTKQMRTAVLNGPGRLAIEKVPVAAPRPREVRVRLQGCGVCGSNLPVWEGRPWFTYPFEPGSPGHEGWGEVDKVGSDVETVKPGDQVALLSYHAFAEYDFAPEDSVLPLPASLHGTPCPGEPLGCAMNVFNRSELMPGQTIAIIGVGFLGALLTSLAAEAKARIIAISRRPYALELARDLGAAETILLDDPKTIIDRVKEVTQERLCDTVIEATGLPGPLDLAGELTKTRGRLVIAGYHQDGPRHINMQLWNWKGLDVINAHERDPALYLNGIRDAFNAIVLGRLNPEFLFTHSFPLEELSTAFETMRARPYNFLKACIRFS